MRLLIRIRSLQDAKYNLVSRYVLQGFIYSVLKNTEFSWLHSYKGFKFFNFSNVFPVEDFKLDKTYNFIISSPNAKLIKLLSKKIRERKGKTVNLGSLTFEILDAKKFDIRLKFPWETATPIVLRKEKEVILSDGFKFYKVHLKRVGVLKELGFKKEKVKLDIKEVKEVDLDFLKGLDKNRFRIVKIKDIYYDFKYGSDSLFEWLQDLKDQSLTKYQYFTGSEFYFEEPLFDELQFRKTVYIKVRIKNRGDILYTGSLWKKLNVLRKLTRAEKKFYKFLMDTGLGSLNSLGFGFINPKK